MLEDALQRLGTADPELAQVCERIVEGILEKPERPAHLSYRSIASAAGFPDVTEELVRALEFLCHENVRFLNQKYEFIEEGDETVEEEISLDELIRAYSEGFLAHPKGGYRVQDFRNKVFVFFVPGEQYDGEKRRRI